VGDENCSCLTNITVKCNSPYSFPLSKLYFKHQRCKIKIKVLKNVIRTIDGSSMLELRRDDPQLFLIHYSFFVSVLYCYIWTILNSKSTPKITPKLIQIWLQKWLQTPPPKKLQTPLHVLQHASFWIALLYDFDKSILSRTEY
jgi:hypothetical protein